VAEVPVPLAVGAVALLPVVGSLTVTTRGIALGEVVVVVVVGVEAEIVGHRAREAVGAIGLSVIDGLPHHHLMETETVIEVLGEHVSPVGSLVTGHQSALQSKGTS